MKWSTKLRRLGRGIKLATRIVRARLDGPPVVSAPEPTENGRLVAFEGFGDNPGRLRMLAHVPPVTAGRPLVVLLHGCGQSAAGFAADSGWADLADRLHFPLILPEQAEANNAGRCFQWFQPADTTRDRGEAASIAAMTRAAIDRFDSDPRQVFIVGLSAGGAMAAALLAAYPDLFAAGAVVAGFPVGSARSALQAIRRMASAGPEQSPQSWAEHVRAAAPADFSGPWPRLSVWQGLADKTVAPENSNQLAMQWRALHGLATPAMAQQTRNGVQHRVWPDGSRRLVELWSLPDLPHAYPIGPHAASTHAASAHAASAHAASARAAAAHASSPAHFVETAPIDATEAVARFFGLD